MGLLYTKMKIFQFNEKINSLPESISAIHPPIQVRIKPTNTCNHNCRYCAYRAEHLQLGKDMRLKDSIPKEKMFEIISDLEQMGVKSVTFSGGGEPFCYPHLLETVKKLSATDIKFAALTNGALLKGEIAEVFAHHATWVRVSMDGWDSVSYAGYRGVSENEFKKVTTNLEKFQSFGGKCYLGVCIIVDRNNSKHITKSIKKFKDIGVKSVKIAPCIISNKAKENNDYHEPLFKKVKEQIGLAIESMGDEDFEIFDSYHTQLGTFKKEYRWCPYLQILPVIAADCNVYSCHDKAYNLNNGILFSLKDQSFKDAWFSDKNRFFKINPSLDCDHHCVVNEHNQMIQDFLGIDKEHADFV